MRLLRRFAPRNDRGGARDDKWGGYKDGFVGFVQYADLGPDVSFRVYKVIDAE